MLQLQFAITLYFTSKLKMLVLLLKFGV